MQCLKGWKMLCMADGAGKQSWCEVGQEERKEQRKDVGGGIIQEQG